MNQNYNGYNNYNNYNQGYNEYGPDNFEEYDDNGRGGGCSGFFGTIFAIVALIGLVYILLRLLGIDAMDYIEKYLPELTNKDKTEEKDNSESNNDNNRKAKDLLKGYCTKIDEKGNYLIEEQKEEDVINGKMNYCESKLCYFSGDGTEEEKVINYETGVLYTYACERDIYTEMPKSETLRDKRLTYGCKTYQEKGNFEQEFKDKEKIKCENGTCVVTDGTKTQTRTCISGPTEGESNQEEQNGEQEEQ